jgi:heme A synthase
MATRKKKLSRRMTIVTWLAVVVAVIGVLIYFEQISLLYVITTLALVALLLIVGFSDLEGVQRGDEGVSSRS